MAEEDKNLMMHVELPILGCHTLMDTDAPESMGFNIKFVNNSYINLQPDTRKETTKLLDDLESTFNEVVKPQVIKIISLNYLRKRIPTYCFVSKYLHILKKA
jgi:hypothetical protein